MKAKQQEKVLKGVRTGKAGTLETKSFSELIEGFNKDTLLSGKLAQVVSGVGEIPLQTKINIQLCTGDGPNGRIHTYGLTKC